MDSSPMKWPDRAINELGLTVHVNTMSVVTCSHLKALFSRVMTGTTPDTLDTNYGTSCVVPVNIQAGQEGDCLKARL